MPVKKSLSFTCLGTIAAVMGLSGLPVSSANASPLLSSAHPISGPLETAADVEANVPGYQIAQFFPYANTNEQVVMVQGLGTASASAETAAIEFVLVNYDPYYDPYACTYGEGATATSDPSSPQECPPPPDPVPLTRASLQPVVDALTAAGIAANQVSVRMPGDASDSYAAYYYTDSASVLLTLDNPSQQQVQELVTAVETAVSDSEAIYLQDRYVQYTLSDAGCNSLEAEAYRSAVVDAGDRAAILAEALGVTMGDVPSVADSSASPFSLAGLTAATYPSYCDTDLYGISSGYYASPSYYDPTLPAAVQVQRGIYVTYPVQGR